MIRLNKFVFLFATLAVLVVVVGVKPVYLAATTLPQDHAREMPPILPQAKTERGFDEFDEQPPIGSDEPTNIRNQILDVLSEIFEPFDLFSVMLHDGTFGWEPDGNTTTFIIDDIDVNSLTVNSIN